MTHEADADSCTFQCACSPRLCPFPFSQGSGLLVCPLVDINMNIRFSQSCILPSTRFLFSLNLLLGTGPGGGAILGVSLAGRREADRRVQFEIQTREPCTKAYRIYIVIQGGDHVKYSVPRPSIATHVFYPPTHRCLDTTHNHCRTLYLICI